MTTQFPNGDRGPQVGLRRTAGSAVRSHKSYERPARQICHHSGQYLTVEENNPERIVGLREQHDFPGLKALDDRFQRAAHAREFQHVVWSRPGIQGVGLMLGAVPLLVGLWLVWTRSNQWRGLVEGGLVFGAMIAAGLGALAMLGAGAWMFADRNRIYHRGARGERPASDDYPLFGSYRLEINEHYRLDLANAQPSSPPDQSGHTPAQNRSPAPGPVAGWAAHPTALAGSLAIEVRPEPTAPELYRAYRDLYRPHQSTGVGAFLHAGAIALEGLEAITFDPPIEYDHRVVLRQLIDEQFLRAGEPLLEPIRFLVPYRVDPSALRSDPDPRRGRSLLTCTPRLADFDSFTLHLIIRWHGAPFECALEECRLSIPPELGSVVHVELGRRAESGGQVEVIWRNLLLEDGQLTLTVRFGEPLLGPQAPGYLTGSYRFVAGGSVSSLRVPPENIWDATGLTALSRTRPGISATSVIEGSLIADIAHLAQEHEHVATSRLNTAAEPGSELVGQITVVLTEVGIDIQRIEEAMPRLDPRGSLSLQLRYWDLSGRKHELAALESVDVHLVVSGSTGGTAIPHAPTTVDVRVRCLHDPRSPQIARAADDVCQLIADALRSQLPPAHPVAALNGGSS